MKKKTIDDIKIPTFDDLFSTEEQRQESRLEKIQEIQLDELHEFKGHPFRVRMDEDMQKLIESIEEHGVIVPTLARPDPAGGYEMVSGHRRLKAAELSGLETIPVIVRELSDDEATIIMVDSVRP